MNADRQTLMCHKDALMQEKLDLQQQLSHAQRQQQDLITEKSGF